MSQEYNTEIVDEFADYVKAKHPISYRTIVENRAQNELIFDELASRLLYWSKNYLGDSYLKVLMGGYSAFSKHVVRYQNEYEKNGEYNNLSYDRSFDEVYDNSDFMNLYHWGVFMTNFCWPHHLKIYEFFDRVFLRSITGESPRILDLGSGSGIWSMLTASAMADARVTSVDISETSISLARGMVEANGLGSRIDVTLGDAIAADYEQKFDAAISCILLEHLTEPNTLLESLARNVKQHGLAFLTAALTAAQLDHIFEFRRESEVIGLAEEAGFRVLGTLSSGPLNYPVERRFLPRTMALVLQKRANETW